MKPCVVCGLVQIVPMRAVMHEYFAPYIDQIPVHRAYFKKMLQSVIPAKAGIQNDKSLLDVGCAMGVLLEEAKRIGLRAQGIDISKEAVAYCRKKDLNVSRTWPKTQFDVICAFEVIEHERDPLGMMRRVHTLLKKGGVAVLTTPNHSGIWRKIMGKWWVGYRHPEHVTFWDNRSLLFLMKKAGFTNVSIRRDCPRPFPLSFACTRAADYFPRMAWFLKPIGKFIDRFGIINPINPWDDLIVYAVK